MIPSTGATPVYSAVKVEPPARAKTGPEPFDAQGRLSRDALDWVQAQALEPARSATWASGLVSAGLFAYFNSGNAEIADRYFNLVRIGVANHKNMSISTQALIETLADDGLRPVVDVFLRVLDDDADPMPRDMIAHATLAGMLGDALVREHPLGGGALLKSQLDALPPGQCTLLFVNNRNVVAVARDSEQLWVFDATLNPDQDLRKLDQQWLWATRRLAPHQFIEGAFGGQYPKCVTGEAAEKLLAAHIKESHTQPLLISRQAAVSELPATA